MKSWEVEYTNHKDSQIKRTYFVVAEDDERAEDVGYESLQDDETLGYDTDLRPEAWYCSRVTALEVCDGCGGYRHKMAPKGQGCVLSR